jgi:hypothetical protein
MLLQDPGLERDLGRVRSGFVLRSTMRVKHHGRDRTESGPTGPEPPHYMARPGPRTEPEHYYNASNKASGPT